MRRNTIVALVLIFICIAIDVAWAILNYILPVLWGSHGDLTPLIPGDVVADWLILWYLIPLLTIPLYVLVAGYTARWLVLPLNKFLNPGHEAFYFAPTTPRPQPILKILRRSIFAVILMFGVALTLTKFFDLRFISYTPLLPDIFNEWNQGAILMPLVFPILGIILVASWLIEDCNIVFHSYSSHGPQQLRNAGETLTTLLKGYAGFFVILDYVLIGFVISELASFWMTYAPPWVPLWFFYLVTFANPFIYLFIPLLALLFYQSVFPRLREQLMRHMTSIGTQQLSRLIDTKVGTEYILEQEDPL